MSKVYRRRITLPTGEDVLIEIRYRAGVVLDTRVLMHHDIEGVSFDAPLTEGSNGYAFWVEVLPTP